MSTDSACNSKGLCNSLFELVEKPNGFSDRKLRTLAPSRLEATLLDTLGVDSIIAKGDKLGVGWRCMSALPTKFYL